MSKRLVMKAIREKCLDCSGGSTKEIRFCAVKECPLRKYRLGKDPDSKRSKNGEGKKDIPKGLRDFINKKRKSKNASNGDKKITRVFIKKGKG